MREAAEDVLLAIADAGNDVALASLNELLARTEWSPTRLHKIVAMHTTDTQTRIHASIHP